MPTLHDELNAAGLEITGRHPDRWEQQEPETLGFLLEGGWHVIDSNSGRARGGLTAHRGVLDDGEYVDPFVLRGLVCDELGFSYELIRSVYRPGRMSAGQRELRVAIDAKVLALSRQGGNMAQLARALMLDDNTIRSAITRAKEIG